MNLAHLLLRQACVSGNRPAIFSGTAPWATYGQWAQRSAGLASQLRSAGLAPGDRILLFMRNHPRYLELLLGVWWAGLVAVPVNAKLHPAEVAWIVDHAQTRWAFVTSDVAPDLLPGLERQVDIASAEADTLFSPLRDVCESPPWAVGPSDTAWLFYTSGTTGRPKGVMLTHRNLLIMGLTYFVDVDSIGVDDVMAYAAPMSHGCGLYAIPHLMAGARHVVPASGGVDPAELFALGKALGPLSTF
ncbi:MAG: AMP-binding protein, partial [Burkholderiaceae bacterium]